MQEQQQQHASEAELREMAETSFAPLKTFVGNIEITEEATGGKEQVRQLKHCLRLIAHGHEVRDIKATVKVRDYAKRKKDLLQAVIDIFDECRHTEKLANERLRVLLKQQSK
jgi:hypothetical protein